MTELQYEIDDLILLDPDATQKESEEDDFDMIRCLIDCEDI